MIKDIIVHLTGSAEDQVRLAYAAGVAKKLDAHLTGLQVNVLPGILSYTDPSGSFVLQELIANANKQADAVGERLSQALSATGLRTELRRLDLFPEAVAPTLATQARVADLFIGTRPYGDPAKSEHIEEAVLFRAGRACIFLPPNVTSDASFDRVVIAWKDTREAARAVAEAMPLIRMASEVDVILVSEGDGSSGSTDAADIGRHLARHGVSAEIRTAQGQPDVASALLREARASRADLLVMGGYGHSRLRELVLGGATRDVLANAPIPVFMAH
jgi:nucleotide-binding universal stress UspA family protein